MGCTWSQEDVVKSAPEKNSPIGEERETKNGSKDKKYPLVGSNMIMKKKSHGTSKTPVQNNLRWGVDFKTADRICNYNRHLAEHSGYFRKKHLFLKEIEKCKQKGKTITFYDSNTGKPLYEAPKGRSWDDFLAESRAHGWPSFRDEEVIWDDMRCLRNGEAVSLAGTHLGHNLPDRNGNRTFILVATLHQNHV